jgi:hypothetical protein
MIGDFKLTGSDNYETDDGMRFIRRSEFNPLKTYLVMLLSPYAEADLTSSATRMSIINAYSTSQYRTVLGADRFVNQQILGKALFLHTTDDGFQSDYNRAVNVSFHHQKFGSSGITTANSNGLLHKDPKTGKVVRRVVHLSVVSDANNDAANVAIPQDQYLYSLGHLRFQTKFIRNLLFIVSAHRMMNAKMNEELSKHPLPVVSGTQASHSSMVNKSEWEW